MSFTAPAFAYSRSHTWATTTTRTPLDRCLTPPPAVATPALSPPSARAGGMGEKAAAAEAEAHAGEAAVASGLDEDATSLGGVESLVEHRHTIEGPDTGIPPNLIRLSVGIEHIDDIISDLEKGFAAAK